MKKIGFTLAEILVVLGIIGVVAALTLPSLMSNTASAQIGPKLAKAVSMFDQANSALLNDTGTDHLIDSGLLEDGYVNKLTDHLKASANGNVSGNPTSACSNLAGDSIGAVTAKDGTVYEMFYNEGATVSGKAAHKDNIGYVLIDINGKADPNTAGTDIFAFSWWGDGSIKPAGGNSSDAGCSWTTDCVGEKDDGTNVAVTNYWACAGHIFENNLKALYK